MATANLVEDFERNLEDAEISRMEAIEKAIGTKTETIIKGEVRRV
jgi:hypothetical protein